MANSTANNWLSAAVLLVFLFHGRFFRWRSSVLKLKRRLRQNSLRLIPPLTKSATNCWTSARVRRFRTITCCSPFILLLQHIPHLCEQVGLLERLQKEGAKFMQRLIAKQKQRMK
jgi:hypothetical protein